MIRPPSCEDVEGIGTIKLLAQAADLVLQRQDYRAVISIADRCRVDDLLLVLELSALANDLLSQLRDGFLLLENLGQRLL